MESQWGRTGVNDTHDRLMVPVAEEPDVEQHKDHSTQCAVLPAVVVVVDTTLADLVAQALAGAVSEEEE